MPGVQRTRLLRGPKRNGPVLRPGTKASCSTPQLWRALPRMFRVGDSGAGPGQPTAVRRSGSCGELGPHVAGKPVGSGNGTQGKQLRPRLLLVGYPPATGVQAGVLSWLIADARLVTRRLQTPARHSISADLTTPLGADTSLWEHDQAFATGGVGRLCSELPRLFYWLTVCHSLVLGSSPRGADMPYAAVCAVSTKQGVTT